LEQRREILRARWPITNTYSHTNSMHGEMYAYAQAAADSSAETDATVNEE